MNAVPRMALLPVSAFYLFVSMVADQGLALFVAGLLMVIVVGLVLRGIADDIGKVEIGTLWLIVITLVLAAVPTVASVYTPGVCTDTASRYEIALLVSIYGGTVVAAHLLSKRFLPADMKAMSKNQARRFMSVPGHMLWILTSPFFASGYLLFWRGTCQADNPFLLIMPLMSLFAIGYVVFLVGGITRNQKAIVKSKMEFA